MHIDNIGSAVKPRYDLLDGLRGVAALMVICYHVFEGFATSSMDQMLNHGYLAVDFFFMLSGFVVGYAYDDRWKKKSGLTFNGFVRRRLVRLHPMLVLGMLIGVITYMIQGCVHWDGTHVSGLWVAIAAVLSCLFVPAYPGAGYEVRGNGEMFPLNGPAWSLFFEYIANILYALLLRRLSTRALALWVCVSGVGLACYALGNMSGFHHIGVGWTLADYGLVGGLLRVGFAFSLGMLLSRVFRPMKVRGAFWICSLAIVAILSVPFMGVEGAMWTNALYDMACVMLLFPLVLYVGASGATTDSRSSAVCGFLGRISYPLYIIHYPFMYLFYAWVWAEGLAFGEAWYVALGIVVGCVALAYLSLKYYDEPVRRWLTNRHSPEVKVCVSES